MADKIKLLGKRVLVEYYKIEEEVKKGGIIIPDTVAKIYGKAKVISIGDDVKKAKVGEDILLPANCGNELEQDGKAMKMITEEMIDAIL